MTSPLAPYNASTAAKPEKILTPAASAWLPSQRFSFESDTRKWPSFFERRRSDRCFHIESSTKIVNFIVLNDTFKSGNPCRGNPESIPLTPKDSIPRPERACAPISDALSMTATMRSPSGSPCFAPDAIFRVVLGDDGSASARRPIRRKLRRRQSKHQVPFLRVEFQSLIYL